MFSLLKSVFRSLFLSALGLSTLTASASAQTNQPVLYGIGTLATEQDIAHWDIDVRPDGQGVVFGRGDVFTGEEVYIEKCAVCHGDFGEAVGRWPVLAGGLDSLATDEPLKTLGSYWPYLTTGYDYIYRAMPFGNAQSLEADEVYGILAYLLYMNDLVEDDFELSHENIADFELPNEGGFIPDGRPTVFFDRCMSDCVAEVEVGSRARVLDVTPDQN